MEINKPELGLFRGIGSINRESHHNRKYFPNIRNQHQFQLTHAHPNNYLSTSKRLHLPHRPQLFQKSHKNSNDSSIKFGTDNFITEMPFYRTDFSKPPYAPPPKAIRPKDEGISLGTGQTFHFPLKTTSMEHFGEAPKKSEISYRQTRGKRFNPITGEARTLQFRFEDFTTGSKGYIAHNVVPRPGGGGLRNNIW